MMAVHNQIASDPVPRAGAFAHGDFSDPASIRRQRHAWARSSRPAPPNYGQLVNAANGAEHHLQDARSDNSSQPYITGSPPR